MYVYKDPVTGDTLLSDAFPKTKMFGGLLWEVQGKFEVKQDEVYVDAPPSLAMRGEKTLKATTSQKPEVQTTVDIIDVFKLVDISDYHLTKKDVSAYLKKYALSIICTLDEEKKELFKKNMTDAANYLLAKFKHLQIFVGESGLQENSSYVFSYNKGGGTHPTFLYLSMGLKEDKV